MNELVNAISIGDFPTICNFLQNPDIKINDPIYTIISGCRIYRSHNLLDLAIEYNSIELVQLLITMGCDCDFKNIGGTSPLHFAVRENLREIVKLLIDAKAQIDSQDDLQTTPLHIAASRNYYEICQMLLENGADTHLRNYFDKTPKEIASSKGFTTIVTLIESYDVPDIKEPD